MKEYPILFSGPMVRAILSGQKTQTRRVVKHFPHAYEPLGPTPLPSLKDEDGLPCLLEKSSGCLAQDLSHLCPYGVEGDRLWVRETWSTPSVYNHLPPLEAARAMQRKLPGDGRQLFYKATHDVAPEIAERFPRKWRPSIHMPKWASRITLEITSVRVERVQQINEEDALAEGVNPGGLRRVDDGSTLLARSRFIELWESINAKRGHGWDENPWVWVIEFRRVEE